MNRALYWIGGGAAILVIAFGYAAASRHEQQLVTQLFPKEPADQLLWPNTYSWAWAVNGIDPAAKGDTLSLVIRVVHAPHKDGEPAVIAPQIISKESAETAISPGSVRGVKKTDSLRASVQLIDLQQVALPGAEQRPLRLLLTFKAGNSGTALRKGDDSVIDGKRVLGYAPNNELKWKDGELHLQCLFVQDDKDRLAIYDIVIVQSE